MKQPNPVTGPDAILFDTYVAKWQTRLNLADWRIERGTKPAKGAMADVTINHPARLASYRLGDFGSEAITPSSLEKTAIHELLHIFLADLIAAAYSRQDQEVLDGIEHRAINVLEKLLAGQQ